MEPVILSRTGVPDERSLLVGVNRRRNPAFVAAKDSQCRVHIVTLQNAAEKPIPTNPPLHLPLSPARRPVRPRPNLPPPQGRAVRHLCHPPSRQAVRQFFPPGFFPSGLWSRRQSARLCPQPPRPAPPLPSRASRASGPPGRASVRAPGRPRAAP